MYDMLNHNYGKSQNYYTKKQFTLKTFFKEDIYSHNYDIKY